jgi:hypothetical protein
VLLVQRSVEAAAPYKIAVTPGNASVPKGADQTVTARLAGFNAADVVLMVKREPTSPFEKQPLLHNDKGEYEGILFGVKGATEYFVEAEGVTSPHYTLKVVDVPYVQRLDLEYKFPAYTGLDPEKIEDGGDIAVLRGTDVTLHITSTMKTRGGRVALNEKESVPLTVQADGNAHRGVQSRQGRLVSHRARCAEWRARGGVPRSTPSTCSRIARPRCPFARPGRDTSASAIEEVFVEAAADDRLRCQGSGNWSTR